MTVEVVMADFEAEILALRARLRLVEAAIPLLESLHEPPRGKKRGRKLLLPEERRQMSERMKKYWRARKGFN